MSTIYLIRHGQASFGSANYDHLSVNGERQVHYLRHYLSDHAVPIDAIYSGPRIRQQQTAQILKGSTSHNPIECSGFDEYDADTLLRYYCDIMKKNLTHDPRAFQRILEETCLSWIEGDLSAALTCSFKEFRERVAGALNQLMQHEGRGKHLLVCTSAGVIGVAIGHVLGLNDRESIKLSWSINNSSITRLEYNFARISLTQFNGLPHLAGASRQGLITFR